MSACAHTLILLVLVNQQYIIHIIKTLYTKYSILKRRRFVRFFFWMTSRIFGCTVLMEKSSHKEPLCHCRQLGTVHGHSIVHGHNRSQQKQWAWSFTGTCHCHCWSRAPTVSMVEGLLHHFCFLTIEYRDKFETIKLFYTSDISTFAGVALKSSPHVSFSHSVQIHDSKPCTHWLVYLE